MKLVLHQSGGHTKLVLHQSGAHITGDTNWFSINLECKSEEKQIGSPSIRRAHQTGSPSIWSAHHRRSKLVLNQSGAHISGDTNWFSINLERISQVTQTGSLLMWSADHR
ncbi:hypothetical protein RRG08_004721 [Elysia crispata]|nr:hypothetical protein RRG08_004721 [Elysia crispata]